MIPTKELFNYHGNLTALPPSTKHHMLARDNHELNAHKYRSDEFLTKTDLNIMFLGCSWAYGSWVEKEDRFSTLVCKELGATEWNFGTPATSREFAARIACSSASCLKPDVAIVLLTQPCRREHIDKDWCMQFSHAARFFSLYLPSPLAKVVRSYKTLDTKQNNEANNYWTYKGLENAFAQAGVKWYYSTCISDEYPALEPSRYIGTFDSIDKASDNKHPGSKSHSLFAQKVLDMIERDPETHNIANEDYHIPLWQYRDDDVSYDYDPDNEPDDLILRDIHRAFDVTCTPERIRVHGNVLGLTGGVELDMLKEWQRRYQDTLKTR